MNTRRTGWLLAAVACWTIAASAQSWRTPAIASFDEVWQTINDTFYDPAFGGTDWAGVRRELRPRVEAAATADEARAVTVEMLRRLRRSHFVLLSASSSDALPGPATVPIQVRITTDGVLVTDVLQPAARDAGLAAGQLLTSIDGGAISERLQPGESIEARTEGLQAWRRVNQRLYGSEGSPAVLRVRDVSGAERTVTVPRTLPSGQSITLGNLPPLVVQFQSRDLKTAAGRAVGFIAFSVWLTPVSGQFDAAIDRFRRHEGVILDLRGNPGGLAAMIDGISGHFLADPVPLGAIRTRQTTLTFKANPRFASPDGRRVDVYRGPLAILVDELTGSTSEIFAGSMQGLGRARVFGRQTMGQALPAMTKQLPTGDVLLYAIGDYTTSAGKSLEGAGVTPDLSILPSPRALASGHDAVLEAALQWIDRSLTRAK